MEAENIKQSQTIESYLDLNDPDKFFDFSDGVDISDKEIKACILDLIYKARKVKKTEIYGISRGNCSIEVFYDADEERADIIVNKNRKEAHIFFKEDGIIDIGRVPLQKDSQAGKWNIDYKIIY